MPDSVSIKGTKGGLVVVLNPNCSFDEIKSGLKEKIEAARGFFQGAKLSLTWSIQKLSHNEKLELERLCSGYGLQFSDTELKVTRRQNSVKPPINQMAICGLLPHEKDQQTLLYSKTLRSGQKIVHDGNVVVWADVNPGSEILSTHSIVVLGNCRGTLQAGAASTEGVIVFAYNLQPVQLRIGSYTTCFAGEQAVNGPHLAYLAGGQIIRESYRSDKPPMFN